MESEGIEKTNSEFRTVKWIIGSEESRKAFEWVKSNLESAQTWEQLQNALKMKQNFEFNYSDQYERIEYLSWLYKSLQDKLYVPEFLKPIKK